MIYSYYYQEGIGRYPFSGELFFYFKEPFYFGGFYAISVTEGVGYDILTTLELGQQGHNTLESRTGHPGNIAIYHLVEIKDKLDFQFCFENNLSLGYFIFILFCWHVCNCGEKFKGLLKRAYLVHHFPCMWALNVPCYIKQQLEAMIISLKK